MVNSVKIIIRQTASDGSAGAAGKRIAPVSPIGRLLFILILVPGIIVLAALGLIFFAIFFGLLVVAVAGFWFRFWWLHRQALKSRVAEEEKYQVIEDAEIIEMRTSKSENTKVN